MMLDIYICEDNKKQREFIDSFVTDFCIFRALDAEVALASHSPKRILEHFKDTQNPALFFLDIELGTEINGIELAGRIREQNKNAAIVFITTHSEMALLALQHKVEALDFIIKDGQDNIKKKIGDCINTVYLRHMGGDNTKKIKISVGDKIIFIKMEEIICVETTKVRHKLRLYTASRAFEFNGEMKTMEEQLDERFIRCHKICIINKDKIESINKKDNTVTMVNESICPVSRIGKKLISIPPSKVCKRLTH
jgi:two-component system response regulator AgrA